MGSYGFFIELIGGAENVGLYSWVTTARGRVGNCFINSSKKKIINVYFYECLPHMLGFLCKMLESFNFVCLPSAGDKIDVP